MWARAELGRPNPESTTITPDISNVRSAFLQIEFAGDNADRIVKIH